MDSLSKTIQRTLELQPYWSTYSYQDRFNSPELTERGGLVKNIGPDRLIELINQKEIANKSSYKNWDSNGSNGSGNIARVPWFRLFDTEYSSGAQDGFYLTFLFNFLGNHMCLSLNQASTSGDAMIPLLEKEISQRVEWARDVVGKDFLSKDGLSDVINLDVKKGQLGYAYALTNITSFVYEIDRVPEEEVIINDINYLLTGLDNIYKALDSGEILPGEYEAELEVEVAETEKGGARKNKGPSGKKGGQGYNANAKERKAIDMRAMEVSIEHYESQGWKVKDVSKKYGGGRDLDVSKNGEKKFVEVKGTTTKNPASVQLTPNEVKHSMKYPENSVLLIVGDIKWEDRKNLLCTGGKIIEIFPWTTNFKDKNLKPIKFKYEINDK
tara:strand:+ start:101 stop:1252 length:1152 start_codon:yes stop_codon:yes gene_type:complete